MEKGPFGSKEGPSSRMWAIFGLKRALSRQDGALCWPERAFSCQQRNILFQYKDLLDRNRAPFYLNRVLSGRQRALQGQDKADETLVGRKKGLCRPETVHCRPQRALLMSVWSPLDQHRDLLGQKRAFLDQKRDLSSQEEPSEADKGPSGPTRSPLRPTEVPFRRKIAFPS